MRGQRHAPAALHPGKDPVSIVQEAGWAPGPVWTGAANLVPTGIRSPDRPARSGSLYRLSYRAHFYYLLFTLFTETFTSFFTYFLINFFNSFACLFICSSSTDHLISSTLQAVLLTTFTHFAHLSTSLTVRNSSVSIATRHGLDRPGFELNW